MMSGVMPGFNRRLAGEEGEEGTGLDCITPYVFSTFSRRSRSLSLSSNIVQVDIHPSNFSARKGKQTKGKPTNIIH